MNVFKGRYMYIELYKALKVGFESTAWKLRLWVYGVILLNYNSNDTQFGYVDNLLYYYIATFVL